MRLSFAVLHTRRSLTGSTLELKLALNPYIVEDRVLSQERLIAATGL